MTVELSQLAFRMKDHRMKYYLYTRSSLYKKVTLCLKQINSHKLSRIMLVYFFPSDSLGFIPRQILDNWSTSQKMN